MAGNLRDELIGRRPKLADVFASRIQVDSVENDIRREMETAVAQRLAIQGNLPPDVKEAVQSTAKSVAASVVELSVARAAEDAARDIGRQSITDRFDEKISVAAGTLTHISGSNEVDEVLRKRSELLAKKRDSLVTAGFSAEEAMQIVLADIAARAH